MTDIFIVIISIIITILAIVGFALRVSYLKRKMRDSLLPTEVREHSHDVANQSLVIRAGLKRIAESPDPLKTLAETMSGTNRENKK